MKPSLSETAACLSAIVDGMEDKQDVRRLLKLEFSDALEDVQKGIDKRKALLREVDSKIELARTLKESYLRQVRRYESIKENLIQQTKELVEKNPNVPFTDSLGKRLVVQRNAQPQMTFKDPSLIPDEFCTITRNPDKSLLREAIENNERLADRFGINLEYGTQLRGMR